MVGFHLVQSSAAYAELSNAIQQNTLVHAYLIAGEKGVGKRSFARFAAARLLAGHAPDHCRDCQRVFENKHPDLHVISAPKQISIEQVRGIIADCAIRPLEADMKIYILEEAERMTPAAQNSLLKILEEPPGNTVFFLTAQSVKSVLPTVLSRCRTLRMDPAPRTQIARELTDRYPVTAEQANLYAGYAGGIMAKAEQFVGKNDYIEIRDAVAAGIDALLNGDGAGAAGAFLPLKGREEIFFDALCAWLSDLIRMKLSRTDVVNADALSLLTAQSRRATVQGLNGMLAAALQAEGRVKQNTAFTSIVDGLVLQLLKCL